MPVLMSELSPEKRERTQFLLSILLVANAALAGLVLLGWAVIAMFVAEPVQWATWGNLQRGNGWWDYFSYPYVMLWGFPLVSVFGAWIARHSGLLRLAMLLVLTPVLFFALTLAVFYFGPDAWR